MVFPNRFFFCFLEQGLNGSFRPFQQKRLFRIETFRTGREERIMERAVPHILIVDDDRTTTTYLSHLMEKEGFKTLCS